MFLTSALSLLAVVFYMHKRRFIILCLGVMIIFAFYALGTVGRGYTSAQLDEIFEPTKIETVKPNDTTESGSTANTDHAHKHTATEVVAATCTAEGYTTSTCDCGDSYISDKTEKTAHTYTTEGSKTVTIDGIYTAPNKEGVYEVKVSCIEKPHIFTYVYIIVKKK